jgi:hypothetical protein
VWMLVQMERTSKRIIYGKKSQIDLEF